MLFLQGERISYNGDPLTDFTLIRFLDRFVYRNPKKSKPKRKSLRCILLHISNWMYWQYIISLWFLSYW